MPESTEATIFVEEKGESKKVGSARPFTEEVFDTLSEHDSYLLCSYIATLDISDFGS